MTLSDCGVVRCAMSQVLTRARRGECPEFLVVDMRARSFAL